MATITAISAKRPTYGQAWPAYNAAQAVERQMFPPLLAELCAGIAGIPQKIGRPPLSLRDAAFTAGLKVYSTLSARRFATELKAAYKAGLVSRVAGQATIHNILGDDSLTPILRSLVERSALPFAAIEETFAVDSSGLKATRLIHGMDKNTGQPLIQHDWVKCHIMCGVKTNIVTAIEIDGRNAYDGFFLAPLLETTQRHFRVCEVLADKGYSSKRNLELVGKAGAVPFIAFQDNATGEGGGMWAKMHGYFQYRREDYLAHYHKRSNVESTFSMVKRKFGKYLRSRTETAMKNEAFCKFLCHNIVVLIHEIHELGIVPEFWPLNSDQGRAVHRIC